MTASLVALDDIAEFINGAAFQPTDWSEVGRRIIRIQNLTDPAKPYNRTTRDVSQALLVQPADLLVSWSASLGVFEWTGPDAAVLNQHIFRVVPDNSRVDKRYLRYGLEEALRAMRRHLHGATMQHVNRGEFLSTRIYLPPLPEQRRIAQLLDLAEELRARRRSALAQLDALTQAIFLDMFGDVRNRSWRVVTVSEMALHRPGAIRTGPFGSQLLHSEFIEAGVAVLGIDNVVENEFRWDERRFISEAKHRQLKRYTVVPGDVLITIMGTCGRCAIVPNDIPLAINTKHLCCITLDETRCLPIFLHAYFLRHPVARRYLERASKGVIMAGLNMALIKALPIPMVPIDLQREFARRIADIEKLRSANRAALTSLEALFVSLQSRAFRGEL